MISSEVLYFRTYSALYFRTYSKTCTSQRLVQEKTCRGQGRCTYYSFEGMWKIRK